MSKLPLVFVSAWACAPVLNSSTQEEGRGAPAPAAAASPAAASGATSLVLVTIDTVRSDHLACYGYFRDTTPHLDRLAAESLRFDGCRTPVAQTTPSHTSIFTGVGPYEHGVTSNHQRRRPGGRARDPANDDEASGRLATSASMRTLAEMLQARGVKTGGFVGAAPVKKETGLGAGFDDWTEPQRARRPGSEVIADALAFLEGCRGKPSFVWVHLFDAHEPLEVTPKPFYELYGDDPKLTEWLAARGFPATTDELSGRNVTIAQVNNRYDGALRWLDEQLEVLLARLREPDLRDRTVIVVVADHGTSNGQHSHMGHGICWDEQFRVPLFVRVPGVAPRVVDVPMSTLDLWPTVFKLAPALADAAFLAQCRGHDVLAEDYSVRPLFGTSARNPKLDAVVVGGRWKLLRDDEGVVQLFDLAADPNELADVAAAQPQLVARFRKLLDVEIDRQKRRAAKHQGREPDVDTVVDPKTLEELRELGYVDGE